MKYCQNCGMEINDDSVTCPYCGVSFKPQQPQATSFSPNYNYVPVEGSAAGWGVLGFFFPLVGWILYFVWKNTKPKAAKAAGIWGLIGVTFNIIIYIVYYMATGQILGY